VETFAGHVFFMAATGYEAKRLVQQMLCAGFNLKLSERLSHLGGLTSLK